MNFECTPAPRTGFVVGVVVALLLEVPQPRHVPAPTIGVQASAVSELDAEGELSTFEPSPPPAPPIVRRVQPVRQERIVACPVIAECVETALGCL